MKKKFRRFAKESTAGTKQQKSPAKRCGAEAGRRHGVMMNEELNRSLRSLNDANDGLGGGAEKRRGSFICIVHKRTKLLLF